MKGVKFLNGWHNLSEEKEKAKELLEKTNLLEETKRWADENPFFHDKEKCKRFYDECRIGTLINKHWCQPDDYLKQRLKVMQNNQQWMHNIYWAVLSTGVFGLWLFLFSKLLDISLFFDKVEVFFRWSVPWLWFAWFVFILVTIILILGWRKIADIVEKMLIRRNLNNYDIESYVIAKILEKKKSCLKQDIEKKEEEETLEKHDNESLIAEYKVLNEAIQKRGSDCLLVDSIMIPSSLVIVTFAIRFRNDLGVDRLFHLPIAGYITLLALLLVGFPYYLWCTTTKIDNICFDRIHEIEKLLHIKGNLLIREKTKCKTWYKIRKHMWHVFFIIFIIAYVVTAFWLFGI